MEKMQERYLEEIPHTTKASPYAVHEHSYTEEETTPIYLHWHPEVELCWLQEGELDFYIEEECYTLRAGDVIFVPPHLLHIARNHAGKKGQFRAFVFSTDLVAEKADSLYRKYVQRVVQHSRSYPLLLRQEIPGISQNERQRENQTVQLERQQERQQRKTDWQQEIRGHLTEIFALEEETENTELYIRSKAMLIWHLLFQNCFSQAETDHELEKLENQLGETLEFLRKHYAEDISLEQMAKTAHMSESQFCRCFKRLTGNTPFTWLKRWRIVRSCAYLTDTEEKISEIAMKCGFNNLSYFNREFLRLMGVTPSRYRRRG